VRAETRLGPMTVACFRRLPGDHREAETIGAADCVTWGRSLALVHEASRGYRAPGRTVHLEEPAAAELDALPASDRDLLREAWETLSPTLDRLMAAGDRLVTLHADFELDNLLFDSGPIPGIIDCDECAWGHPVSDLAKAVSELFDDRPSRFTKSDARMADFLVGYRSVTRLSDDEIAALPDLMLLARIARFPGLAAIRTEGREEGEPQWCAGIRDKLGQILDLDREELRLRLTPGT
jgi:Ser/Thr protein kinase RdoA (MazF antagonist)